MDIKENKFEDITHLDDLVLERNELFDYFFDYADHKKEKFRIRSILLKNKVSILKKNWYGIKIYRKLKYPVLFETEKKFPHGY